MLKNKSEIDCKEAAELLEHAHAQILLLWKKRCLDEIDYVSMTSELALGSFLPRFLERCVEFLRSPLAEFERTKKSKNFDPPFEPRIQSKFTLGQMSAEFQMLRKVLLDVLEAEFRLSRAAREMVLDYVDLATNRAALDFADGPANERLRHQLSSVVLVTKIGFYDWDILADTIEFSEQMRKDWHLDSGCGLETALARIHPDDRVRVNELISQARLNHEDFKTEYRIVLTDGTWLWIEAQGTVTYNPNNEAVRFFGTSLNISNRKKAEEALRSERNLLENIFQATPAGMALWSGPQFVFERVNPSFEAFFEGRSLQGMPVLEALPELRDQAFPKLIEQVFITGETHYGHEVLVRLVRKQGGPIEDRYYDFAYVRIDGLDGAPYGVYDFSLDVTERVLARRALEHGELTLKATIADLENERELRERFVSALSHDLRTPLTSAKMAAQLVSRKLDDPERVKTLSERIIGGVDRADRMIRDLLDANRIKAGQGIKMDFGRCELNEILHELSKGFEELHPNRLRIENCLGNPSIYWDANAIQRVLENLVGNAFKYGDPSTSVTLTLQSAADCAQLAVHNFGSTIADSDQLTLFDPYRRTATAESGEQKGWGIGLSLVKGITEAHGGSVVVESDPVRGTTFTVRLPLDARKKEARA